MNLFLSAKWKLHKIRPVRSKQCMIGPATILGGGGQAHFISKNSKKNNHRLGSSRPVMLLGFSSILISVLVGPNHIGVVCWDKTWPRENITINNICTLHCYFLMTSIIYSCCGNCNNAKYKTINQTLHWGWLLAFELVSLPPEHRNTQRDRDTKQIIHRSYQDDTRQ